MTARPQSTLRSFWELQSPTWVCAHDQSFATVRPVASILLYLFLKPAKKPLLLLLRICFITTPECSVLLFWRCHSQLRWTGARVCPEVTWRPTLQLCATLQGLPRTFCLSFLLICCKNFIRKRERENKQLLTTVQAFKDTAFDPKCNSCF